jgi:hypothetical protein
MFWGIVVTLRAMFCGAAIEWAVIESFARSR